MDWFRSHHGAPSDTKLTIIARMSGQRRSDVTAVWWEVLDYASQNSPRGSVKGIDFEVIAVQQDLDCHTVSRIVSAFHERGMIDDSDMLAAWQKRQPKREDSDASERKRAQREKAKLLKGHHIAAEENMMSHSVTQRHEMSRLDKIREEEIREERDLVPSEHTPQRWDRLPRNGLGHYVFPAWFLDLMAEYPPGHKGSNIESYKACVKALSKKGVKYESIRSGVRAYTGYIARTGQPVAHPSTWFNQERWTIDYSPEADPKPERHQRDTRDPAARARDKAEEIKAKRRVAREAAARPSSIDSSIRQPSGDNEATEGRSGGAGSAHGPAITNLCESEDVRGQGRDDGIPRWDVPDGS